MKKLLTSLTLGLALTTGVCEARAALLTDWSYNLSGISFEDINTNFVSGDSTGISFESGMYGIDLDAGTNANGNLAFSGPDTSANTENNTIMNQTTADKANTSTPATLLGSLTFKYEVASISNPLVKMDITYSIPLYTYFDSNAGTAYIYYNGSEVSTMGATAITHDGFSYGITGVGMFVDGRALVSMSGGEGDPNTYHGWAINDDTMKNMYKEYVVGGDNNVSIGSKGTVGEYEITGVFSITNTDLTPTATPEPATMLLTGLGLAGLGAIKRRRNKIQ